MNLTHWQYKILKVLGINPYNKLQRQDALAGASKHGRQKRKSPYWRTKRKKRRLMARASRRRNRR